MWDVIDEQRREHVALLESELPRCMRAVATAAEVVEFVKPRLPALG